MVCADLLILGVSGNFPDDPRIITEIQTAAGVNKGLRRAGRGSGNWFGYFQSVLDSSLPVQRGKSLKGDGSRVGTRVRESKVRVLTLDKLSKIIVLRVHFGPVRVVHLRKVLGSTSTRVLKFFHNIPRTDDHLITRDMKKTSTVNTQPWKKNAKSMTH